VRPGSLVVVHKFEDEYLRGIYLGASRRFDGEARGCLGRFLTLGGEIVDVDLGNQLVYNFTVL
jgi:hypothetical protein